jgi:hypothetical protein
MLGKDERVYREFSNPTFLAEVRNLTGRVQAATERAADNGLTSWPNWLKDYTVEELWCFSLARDLTVCLATLDGVSREHSRLALQSADDFEWDRHVRKALTKYGDGPDELRGLRARIPLDPPATLTQHEPAPSSAAQAPAAPLHAAPSGSAFTVSGAQWAAAPAPAAARIAFAGNAVQALAGVDPNQFRVFGVPDAAISLTEIAALQGSWEQADAVVIGAREAASPPGVPAAPLGVFDITLDVMRAEGSSYSTVVRIPFANSRNRDLLCTPGTRFKVRIDPANPRLLAIETASLAY